MAAPSSLSSPREKGFSAACDEDTLHLFTGESSVSFLWGGDVWDPRGHSRTTREHYAYTMPNRASFISNERETALVTAADSPVFLRMSTDS